MGGEGGRIGRIKFLVLRALFVGGDGCVSTESSEVGEEWPETWRTTGERRV